ncbi:MAG TPA: chemotaxis protein CheA, partial [bacterium]|nr:chemotaxis protein CheA [bacterium]
CVFITRESSEKVSQLVNEVLEVKGVQIVLIPADPAWNVLSCGDAADSDSRESPESFHEHIKKLQSVRVDVLVLDKLMNLVEELTICKLRFADLNMRETSMGLKAAVEQMGRLTDDLQNEVMKARLVPVGQIFERFPRFVRDMAKAENKKVRLDMVGADIELDRTVLDEMGEPLIHLIRNAVDHGIESPAERKTKNKSEDGTITLSARREKNSVFIEVSDDGKGISVDLVKKQALAKGLVTHEVLQQMNDHEVLLLTTQPGFSTKEAITRVSGRGVGLDVARTKMEKLGGSLLIQSQRDEGTKFSMRLPLTTAVIKALLVKSQGRTYAMPVANIIELVIVKEENINTIENRETFFHRDRVLPLVRMDWESHAYEARNALNVVVVETGNNPFGIVVDSLVSQQDIVVKQLARELRGVRGIAGATILGDGNVALVLDVAGLV